MMSNEIMLILHRGGLGDFIQAIPSLRWLYEEASQNKYNLYVPIYLESFFKNLFPNQYVKNLKDAEKEIKPDRSVVALGEYPNSMSCHTAKLYNIFFCNRFLSDEQNSLPIYNPKSDLSKFNLPKRYAVIVGMYTEPIRRLLPEEMAKVIRHLKEKGVEPVIVGKKKNYFTKGMDRKSTQYGSFTNCINLIDKTNVEELLTIMHKAECVIGPDSGPLHLAGLTNTPIIGAFNIADPAHRMPYRKGKLGHDFYPVVPYASLDCRFCQSECKMELGTEFNKCKLNTEECLPQLSGEKFIRALKEIL
jgi:ADP-heptose:LPS heptosyltransferase